jgi:hypothetical protein
LLIIKPCNDESGCCRGTGPPYRSENDAGNVPK